MHTVQKNCEKKNQCVDSNPISFFFLMSFAPFSLPLFYNVENQKEFYELIELTSH